MENNLDAKTPRLNPYDPPAGQMKQRREKLPPPPMEMPNPAASAVGGHYAAVDPYMGEPTGLTDMYPYGAFAGAGPAAGMQQTVIRAPGAPSSGFPAGVAGPSYEAAGAPTRQASPQAMPGTPSGMPGRGAAGLAPLTPFNQPIPVTTESTLYINGLLRTFIGRKVTVEFLIGTNTFTDRTGILLAVGANYIVLNEVETDDIVVCDFFSIKFVRVYY